MRIALFHNLPSGGGKRALYEWTRRLAKEHTIDAFSLATADHDFCDIGPFVSQHYVFDFAPRGLFKSPFGRLNQLQRLRDLHDLERTNQKIAKQLNAGNYDVLFAHTCMYTFIPALMQYVEIPSIYYLHEPFGPGFVRTIERPYLHANGVRNTVDRVDPLIALYQHRLLTLQERSIQKTNRLLSNSRFTSDCMKVSFGVDSAFCPIGVDIETFQPSPTIQREDFVLSIGELSPRKGFDFIVQSLGQIPDRQRPALRLACNMVQENELRFIQDLAKRYRVDLQVLTKVDAKDLMLLYNRARFCVYAPVMEPFGLVPLEAMACGTAVVGIREGGVQESIVHEKTGLLVDRDPKQFGKAIETLIANPDLVETYGCQGREYVTQNWTWEKSTAMLSTYFIECMNLVW